MPSYSLGMKNLTIGEFTEKSRGLRGPVLSLPKEYLDFLGKSLRLCGFFSKVIY